MITSLPPDLPPHAFGVDDNDVLALTPNLVPNAGPTGGSLQLSTTGSLLESADARAQIKLTKATYQSRARQAIILMRLDLDGPPHRNPDDQEIPCPHLHIYREGYGDKWAFPAPIDRYPNVQDLFSTFEAFMRHCNITDPPRIEKGLFS